MYRLSGETVTSDPRREEAYRKAVVEGLGFGSDAAERRSSLSADDLGACRDVLSRKAAAFWLEGTPRTTVRGVAHDCVPTGPPVSLQPHSLKGESAAWVDEQLEAEVQRGQLIRGSSPWGSPPFPTKEAPTHKRHRKRRLVVDYRRVNARVLRSTYYCRKASDVLAQCAGSIWFSFVDAVTGFNQIQNTRRAMEVLAIVARSGKFLPVCLTFGPVNGPDDFCYVVDRAFGPGRGRKNRYTREWVAYVDDLTIRTGRVVDGSFRTDAEHEEEVRRAMRDAPVTVGQPARDALEALGVQAEALGTKGKHDPKVSDHNHPSHHQRPEGWVRPRVRDLLWVWSRGVPWFWVGFWGRAPFGSGPSGLGSGEGRLFVHWSKDALDKPEKHTGVRSGTDAVVITTVGRLKEGKVDMRTGVDGVILTSEVPPRCFDSISMFDGETGKEGDLLWTRQDGLVPIELPTGDTDESSSEDEAEGRQRSGAAPSQPGRGVKKDPEEPAVPAAVESSPPGRDPAPAVSPVKDEVGPPEQGAAPAASPVKRRPAAKIPKGYHGEPPNFWWAHLPKELWQREGYCLLCKTRKGVRGGCPVDEDHLLSEQHIEEMFKMEARYEEQQRQQAKAAPPQPEREAPTQPALPAAANPVKKEVAEPSAASSSAGPAVKSEAEVQEAKQAVVASLTRTGGLSSDPGRAERPDRMKGEMSKEELQAIWSKEGRTRTARLVESLLGGAAADELRHQEGAVGGLSQLMAKQEERPTEGGAAKLEGSLRMIASATTTAAVTRKRSGLPVGDTESGRYGEAVTRALPVAAERLELAHETPRARIVGAAESDTRLDAGLRAVAQGSTDVSRKVLKKQARSRMRAEEHRKSLAAEAAASRLANEEPDDSRANAPPRPPDDGLDDLPYEEGSWVCGACKTVNGPKLVRCEGWIKGERCGERWESMARYAKSGPPRRRSPDSRREAKRLRTETVLSQVLQRPDSWWCSRCWSGNLCFRNRCYKCSAIREEPDEGSSDDGHHPKPSQQLTEEIQKFLAQSQRRVKKKRVGTKHKKSHKKRKRIRSGGSAVKSAVRGLRATRSAVKSTVRGLRATRKKRLRKKTKRQGWALSRRARNRRAHALNGNGFSFGSKATLVLAAFLAPVVRRVQLEMEEIVETGSEAFQVVIAEGGEELASFIETVFSTARFAIVGLVFWWVSRKVANVMMHMAHGNATPRLVQFDGNVSTWEVKGTRGVHRVRIAGRAPGCACREFLRTGTCDHVEVALGAHKKLVGPQSAEASAASTALARGKAAAEGRSVESLGLSACFQGLVEKAKGLRSEAQPGSSGDQGQQLREPEESQTPEFAVRKERENKSRLALEDVSPWTGVALSRGGRGSQDQELNVQLLINKESQEAILSALQTLKGGEVIATAYTLDQPDLVEGLLVLGGSARLVVDKGQSHGTRTKLQFQSLQQLVRGGVRVRVVSGSHLAAVYSADNRDTSRIGKGQRGIQHSKTFAISKDGQFQLIIGSCNWTTASRSNAEAGVLLTGSCGHEVYRQYTENFERLWKEAVVFDGTRVAEEEPRRRVFGKQSAPTEED